MTRVFLSLAAVLFAATGSVGCTEAPAPESVGYVSIPLTASGGGGATYHLPPFTSLLLSGAGFFGSFSLDDDTAVKTVKVPPGDYAVFLSDGKGDSTVFPLIRENADGSFDTVPATLDLTPAITVTENETTPLVIRFHVPIVGSITFAVGSVDVSVAIDETAATSFDIELSIHEATTAFVTVGDTAPAELASRLPATGDTGHSYVASMHTTGPWTFPAAGAVCVPVAGSVHAGGNQGFADLIAEAPPSGGEQLCIQQLSPEQAFISLSFFASGTPTTPLLSDLPARQFFVNHAIFPQIDARLFDGTTLRLKALEGIHTANTAVTAAISAEVDTPDGGTTFEFWHAFEESGTGTITLTPR
ncbi:MAG TPA: hypothetical protein VFT22_05105 [Kofleriaceae bacterium]|nr:hypothetical protein [Kofleriaceae bacterium]